MFAKGVEFETVDMAAIEGFGNILDENQILELWSRVTGIPVAVLEQYLKLGMLFGGPGFFGVLISTLIGDGLFTRNGETSIGTAKSKQNLEVIDELPYYLVAEQKIIAFKDIQTEIKKGQLYRSGNPVVDSSVNNYTDQCTAYVAYRRPDIIAAPDGKDWIAQNNSAFYTGSKPQDGAILVEGATPENPSGHVAYVEHVNSDGTLIISEQNNPWGSPPHIVTIDPSKRSIIGYIYGKK